MGNFSSPLRTPAFRHSTFDTPIKQARVEPALFFATAIPLGSDFFEEDSMIRLLLAALVICAPALAHDNGQYESVSPEVRAWFRAQKSPKTGALCCNEADGLYAEEDMREGHYWTRWAGRDWQPVPDEVVIRQPNPHGAPVVWWYVDKGEVKIRCFAPGSGV